MHETIENIIKKNLPEEVDDDGFAHDPSKEYPKKIICDICGKEYIAKNKESVCDDCFNGCSDPSYHNGEPCDGSC